jgi:hypothetical protein
VNFARLSELVVLVHCPTGPAISRPPRNELLGGRRDWGWRTSRTAKLRLCNLVALSSRALPKERRRASDGRRSGNVRGEEGPSGRISTKVQKIPIPKIQQEIETAAFCRDGPIERLLSGGQPAAFFTCQLL